MPDSVHLEILHTPLLNLQMIPDFIVWLDEAIGQISIYRVTDHLPVEGLVLYPLPVDERSDGNLQRHLAIRRLLQERFPVVKVEYSFITLCVEGDDGLKGTGSVRTAHCHLNSFTTADTQQKVERGDVLRYRDVAVVGIDGGQVVAQLHIVGGRRAGCQQHEQQKRIEQFHHIAGAWSLSK